jgi:hypothetical protein
VAKVRVVMLTHAENLNPGEVAGFEETKAAQLVAREWARYADKAPVTPEARMAPPVEKVAEAAPPPAAAPAAESPLAAKEPEKPVPAPQKPEEPFFKRGRRG